jgi:hypothetical protein
MPTCKLGYVNLEQYLRAIDILPEYRQNRRAQEGRDRSRPSSEVKLTVEALESPAVSFLCA